LRIGRVANAAVDVDPHMANVRVKPQKGKMRALPGWSRRP
jgi:hypothetical protein